jgi:RNA polymerase sigma factor (sigma-70 family)
MPQFLTRDEEYALIARAQSGDITARNTLIERNLGLIHGEARKAARHSRMDGDELLGVAVGAFILCIEKFDFRRGCRLSTPAVTAMRNSAHRAAYESFGSIRIPGGYCSPSMIARMTPQCVAEIARARNVKSIHTKITNDRGELDTLAEAIPFREEERDGGAGVPWHEVARQIDLLPPRYKAVVQMRGTLHFGQIGEVLGVSSQRAKQIYDRAVEMIREGLGA